MKKIFLIIITSILYVSADKEGLLDYYYDTDEVPGGSYKYYHLMYDGFIKIKLISETGDTDLYVSQTTRLPTYEPDHNCLQSVTCGEDIILIPDSFKRPVSIGVYGHPSHETSKFILLVYNVNDNEDIPFERNVEDIYNSYNYENQDPSFTTSAIWYLLDIAFKILF